MDLSSKLLEKNGSSARTRTYNPPVNRGIPSATPHSSSRLTPTKGYATDVL
jgi:hypothetical protein